MISITLENYLNKTLASIRESGQHKHEQPITSPQGPRVFTTDGEKINLCSNDYLGLASAPAVVTAAVDGLKSHGFGTASARFICGTHDLHRTLEMRIARFLGAQEAILYSSGFDANCGLFESFLGPEDCIISDELNHASIIDGVRLVKAQRKIYRHVEMSALEARLREASKNRFRLVATDGVFSMSGDLAPLPEICALAEEYDALVMVDDSHATGVVGATGRGTPEYFAANERVDIITSTLGKALGGASGGFTTGRHEIIELLRQRSRPYLFSTSVTPAVVSGALKALDLLELSSELVERLQQNAIYFRRRISEMGFKVPPGIHPIIPIVLGDDSLTIEMSRRLNERGILVKGFTYPVVPVGTAKIRIQVSAAHSRDELDSSVQVLADVARELGSLGRT